MKLALSNFAWDDENQDLCFKTLKDNRVDNVEIILNKINGKIDITNSELINYKEFINSYGLNIYSIQSLFYNTLVTNMGDVNLIIKIFKKIIKYAKILNVKVLVFGSPSIRKQTFKYEESIKNIFRILDKMLENTGIILVIEPNSRIYKGEFFIKVDEIVSFIEKNGLINIKTMIDTHNLISEGVCPIKTLHKNKKYINHIHISELGLLPLKDKTFHIKFSKTLKDINYDKIITYEVINNESTLESIKIFSDIYNF